MHSLMMPLDIGTKISNLEIISLPWKEEYPDGRFLWTYKCRCVCGQICERSREYLFDSAKVKSCGCLQYAHTTKHNLHKTKLYRMWDNMKSRCLNPNHGSYHRYGGRGIKITEAWLDFLPFYKWAISSGYEEYLTLDRENVNGDYCPTNCRFITKEENTRRAHIGIPKKRQQVICVETGQIFKDAFEVPESLRINNWVPSMKSVYYSLSTGSKLCGKHYKFI